MAVPAGSPYIAEHLAILIEKINRPIAIAT